jgi:hypothetical protein
LDPDKHFTPIQWRLILTRISELWKLPILEFIHSVANSWDKGEAEYVAITAVLYIRLGRPGSVDEQREISALIREALNVLRADNSARREPVAVAV